MANFDEQLKIMESTKRACCDMVEEIRAHVLMEHTKTDREKELVEHLAGSIIDSINTIHPDNRSEGNPWALE